MSATKPFPMPGSVWRWTGDHTTPPSGPHTVSALAWAYGATWAVMDESEPGYYVEAMMRSDAWVCDSAAPPDELSEHEAYGRAYPALRHLYEANVETHVIQQATDTVVSVIRNAWARRPAVMPPAASGAPPWSPALSWAQAVDIVKMLAPDGSIAQQAAAVIRIAEGREAAPGVNAAPIGSSAPRPKVGTWQPDLEGHDRTELLYDDRGQMVGGYNPRSAPGHDWFAVRPLLSPATGIAASPSDARRAIVEVLKTWADVSAVETE